MKNRNIFFCKSLFDVNYFLNKLNFYIEYNINY